MNLENVVIGANGEVIARELEAHVGKRIALLALDSVLAIEALLGAYLFVEELGNGGWESDQRRARVEDDTSAIEFSSIFPEGNSIEFNFPIGLAAERNHGHLAREVRLVDAAEGGHGLGSVVGATKIEGKNRLVKEPLVDHVVKGRGYVIDGDSIVAETKDAVEAAESECKAGLFGSFTEVLSLNLEVTNSKNVVGYEARDFA